MYSKGKLSSYVPRISKSEFDNEATKFLSRYYPEALESPMAVPIEYIARKKLGLKVVEIRLTEDFSVLGQMCFTGGVAEIYDLENDEYREIIVTPGTMIIDPDTFTLRNLGSKRNTIAHECVHWIKHRNYHIVESLRDEMAAVACRCPIDIKNENHTAKWTDEDWMEWQANGIAPRILMPKETVRVVYQKLEIESKENPFIAANLMPPTRWIIEQVAAFYQVSKQAAKIRLIELGHLS